MYTSWLLCLLYQFHETTLEVNSIVLVMYYYNYFVYAYQRAVVFAVALS